MSKHLKRYVFLFKKLQNNDLEDEARNAYEDEMDEIYYELDDDDIEYIVENELEV